MVTVKTHSRGSQCIVKKDVPINHADSSKTRDGGSKNWYTGSIKQKDMVAKILIGSSKNRRWL